MDIGCYQLVENLLLTVKELNLRRRFVLQQLLHNFKGEFAHIYSYSCLYDNMISTPICFLRGYLSTALMLYK